LCSRIEDCARRKSSGRCDENCQGGFPAELTVRVAIYAEACYDSYGSVAKMRVK
jgi:hypothetical protein